MCFCELVRVCVWPSIFLWCSNTLIIYGSKKPQKTDFLPKWFRSHTETQTEKSLLLTMESLHVRTGRVKASFLQLNMRNKIHTNVSVLSPAPFRCEKVWGSTPQRCVISSPVHTSRPKNTHDSLKRQRFCWYLSSIAFMCLKSVSLHKLNLKKGRKKTFPLRKIFLSIKSFKNKFFLTDNLNFSLK